VHLVGERGCALCSFVKIYFTAAVAASVAYADTDGMYRFAEGSDACFTRVVEGRTSSIRRSCERLHSCCVLAYQQLDDGCAESAVAASAGLCCSARTSHIQQSLCTACTVVSMRVTTW
jgi:hypothetical protein